MQEEHESGYLSLSVTDYAHIKRCFDVTNDDIVAATESRETTLDLLLHLAAVSQPDTGAPKVVLVFAMMATAACEWLDGALRVDLKAAASKTQIDVTSELGGGLLERVFPTLRFDVEIGELSRTIGRAEKRIAPLRVLSSTGTHIVLGATEAERRSTMPPQGVRIADDHIFHPTSLRAAKVPDVDIEEPMLPLVGAKSPSALPRPRKSTGPPKADGPPDDIDSGWDDE
jgi:hypothetical protein